VVDEFDSAQELEQQTRDAAIAAASKPIKPGVPGDCDLCGEWSGRLIEGVCAPCRDRYKLP
jgi:hypothetical protein